MLIDIGELQLIYENLNDIDIKKDIKNILDQTNNKSKLKKKNKTKKLPYIHGLS